MTHLDGKPHWTNQSGVNFFKKEETALVAYVLIFLLHLEFWGLRHAHLFCDAVNQLELLVLCIRRNSIYHLQIRPQTQGYLPINPHFKIFLFRVVLATRGQQNTCTKLQAAIIPRCTEIKLNNHWNQTPCSNSCLRAARKVSEESLLPQVGLLYPEQGSNLYHLVN